MADNVNESEQSAPREIKSFRADAARGNCLTMRRPDLQFRAKEISRAMSKPTKKDQRKIGCVAKYFKDLEKQRIKLKLKFVALDICLTVHTDSAWAGCRSSRNSEFSYAMAVMHSIGGWEARLEECLRQACGCTSRRSFAMAKSTCIQKPEEVFCDGSHQRMYRNITSGFLSFAWCCRTI